MNKDKLLNIEINGEKTQVPEGATVLDAAKKLGIFIPSLCYHEALSTYAACRICIVEMHMKKNNRINSWIEAACVYPVEDGLSVKTNSPKVNKERKLVLELLLSKSPDSHVLNELAVKYGADKNRFTAKDMGESNCILCGLCVRVCNEMMKIDSIGTAYRGINKKVITPYRIANELCVGCTACAYVCPTAAIRIKESKNNTTLENWDTTLFIQDNRNKEYPGIKQNALFH